MTSDHSSKRIKKTGASYPWSIFSNAVLAGLVSHALVGCVALEFSLWHIRQLHTHIQAIMWKHRLLINTVCRAIKDTSFSVKFRHLESMPSQEISSHLQYD